MLKEMLKVLDEDNKKLKRIIAIETALILFFIGVIVMFMFKCCYHDPNNPQISQKQKTNYVKVIDTRKKKGEMWVEEYNV
jgi:hypothetical protein